MPSCLATSLASCTETSDLSHILMWDKQACMKTTVIVTRFGKHVQYSCLIRGDKIDFFAYKMIICSSMILIKTSICG